MTDDEGPSPERRTIIVEDEGDSQDPAQLTAMKWPDGQPD